MSIIHQIQGRDALLVWAIPFATGRMRGIAPDRLVRHLCEYEEGHTLASPKFSFPPAFNLREDGMPAVLPASQWEELAESLELLKEDLDSASLSKLGDWKEWLVTSVKLFPGRVYVWVDEFEKWLEADKPLDPIEFCDNPIIPDSVKKHFSEDLALGNEAYLPADQVSLSEYLGLLEVGSHRYRELPLVRLYHQLEEGLRIYDSEGRAALYHGFKMRALDKGKPVLVDDSWPTLYEDGVTNAAELGRFYVRREDVAAYWFSQPLGDSAHFYWLRRNGEHVSLWVMEKDRFQERFVHLQPHFVGFVSALDILRRRFDKPGHQVTPGEVAMWLSRGFIRARTSCYSCAWEVDYSRWVDQQRAELAPGIPSLEDCLQPLFFDKEELERLDNLERYLPYEQLVQREKRRGLDEPALIPVLSGDGWFRQVFFSGYHPAPLSKEDSDSLREAANHAGSGPIRRFLPGLMYPVDVVEEWERREAPRSHERPEAGESVALGDAAGEVEPATAVGGEVVQGGYASVGVDEAPFDPITDTTLWEILWIFNKENAMNSRTIGEIQKHFDELKAKRSLYVSLPDRDTLEKHIIDTPKQVIDGSYSPKKGKNDPRMISSAEKVLAFFLCDGAMKSRTVKQFCSDYREKYKKTLGLQKVTDCIDRANALTKQKP